MQNTWPKIKIFQYIEKGDFFVPTEEYQELAESLYLTEWNSVVWIGRLFAMDNDFGEHWFDNPEALEERAAAAEKLGYQEHEILVLDPDRFQDGRDGPCHSAELRKQFWTEVLQNLELSLETLIKKAREEAGTTGITDGLQREIQKIMMRYGLVDPDPKSRLAGRKGTRYFSVMDVDEMSGAISMGMKIYVNPKKKKYIIAPGEDMYGMEGFEEEEEELEKNWIDYKEVERMSSTESYRVMEDFTETVADRKIRKRLQEALNRPKPFRNFRYEVDNSGRYRELWFAFKDQAEYDWVQQQVLEIEAWREEEE